MNVRDSMQVLPGAPDAARMAALGHRDGVTLEADNSAPRRARELIAARLAEWRLPEFTDAAGLVASELVTNSVAATEAVQWAVDRPPVRLRLRAGPGVVALLAWDATVAPPAPRQPDGEEENGRGLAIVTALSAEWGYYYPPDTSGKITWAIIDTP